MSTAKRLREKRKIKDGKYTIMTLNLMDTPAWRALSIKAQALYPWLRLEWRGNKNNNNGKIALSCRSAAYKMSVTPNTAAKAFQELQRKGFIVVTRPSYLGTDGEARLQYYELTELVMPGSDRPRHLYTLWTDGYDYDIISPVKNKSRIKK